MNLSEIRGILLDEDIRLTRSLGQTFLHDETQIRRIVSLAGLSGRERVLEIGPGLGPLTGALLQVAGHVTAIEKDRRLVKLLGERFGHLEHFTLLHDDALRHVRRASHDWSNWKLVANLPYSIASPLLVDLAAAEDRPQSLVVTLQLEVARRLLARAGDRDCGLLTLLVGLHYAPGEWFVIPRGCFFPKPNVDSACVALHRRGESLLSPELDPVFKKVVKRGFSERRKMLMKLLKHDWSAEVLAAVFEELGLDQRVRAEKVSLEQFVQLTKRVSETNPPGPGQ